MFIDTLVVIANGKANAFKNEVLTLMDDYYQKLDENEARRFKDMVKIRINEVRDSNKESEISEFIEALVAFLKQAKHPMAGAIEERGMEHEAFIEVGSEMLMNEMQAALAKK